MKLIFSFLLKMPPYMLICLPIILLWRVLRVQILRKRGLFSRTSREFCIVLFFLYLAGLASQTIIPTEGEAFGASLFDINFQLFKVFIISYRDYIYNDSFDYLLISLIGNILMFVPIGFFLQMLYKLTKSKAVLIAFSISLAIELIQLPMARWTDIDDLWLNTLGAFLGCSLFSLLSHFDSLSRFHVSLSGNTDFPAAGNI